jgi:hypothetical protein
MSLWATRTRNLRPANQRRVNPESRKPRRSVRGRRRSLRHPRLIRRRASHRPRSPRRNLWSQRKRKNRLKQVLAANRPPRRARPRRLPSRTRSPRPSRLSTLRQLKSRLRSPASRTDSNSRPTDFTIGQFESHFELRETRRRNRIGRILLIVRCRHRSPAQ